MNYLILSCSLVCLVLTVNGQLKDDHLEVRKKCYKEVGLPNDSIQTASYRDEQKSKCYLRCQLEALGSIKDNAFDIARSIELIPEAYRDQSRQLIEACVGKIADIDDKCEKPFEGIKCLEDEAPALLIELGLFEPPRKA